MTQRAVTVLLTAVTGPYVANMGRAATATAGVGTAAQGAQAKTGALGGSMSGLSTKLLSGGGLVFALKQAGDLLMEYEDALVGVGKTTGLTGDELGALGNDLSELAVGIEGSAEDMLNIAQSAAQLGVENDNIAEFTEVIANMASATDLTVDSAATDMARLSNILGRPIEDVEALGSSIVALGNNMATTEPEIVSLAMRLAAAGRTAGLTDADVVGLAASMSELGVEAEAGGTAMSRVLNEITRAVATGSDSLDSFAETAGMSAQEFTEAWSSDPSAALQQFLDGLGQLSDADRFQVMEDLGLDAARLTDVLLRTSSGADGLAAAFDLSNTAMEENVALAEEAEVANERLSVAVEGLMDKLKLQARTFLGNEEGAQLASTGVRALTESVDFLVEAWNRVQNPFSWVQNATGWMFDLGVELGIVEEDVHAVAAASGALTADQAMLATAARGSAGALDDLGGAAHGAADGVDDLYASNQDLADQLRAQTDPMFALKGALDDATEAQQAYQDVFDDPDHTQQDHTDAAWELYEAELALAGAALEAGEGVGFAIERVDALEDSNRISARMADELREAIRQVGDAGDDVAGDYMMHLDLEAAGVLEGLSEMERRISQLVGRRWEIDVTTNTYVPSRNEVEDALSGTGGGGDPGGGGFDRRAAGGPVSAGQTYLVGEEGPELFTSATSGRIVPAGQTAQMMGGGGGQTVNHNQKVTVVQKDGNPYDDAYVFLRRASLAAS